MVAVRPSEPCAWSPSVGRSGLTWTSYSADEHVAAHYAASCFSAEFASLLVSAFSRRSSTKARQGGASSVDVCALLEKPARHEVPVECRYVGFTVEDELVVGYVSISTSRNLRYIGVI